MPWQNIIDIILIFSGNTSECFVFSCHQSLSLSPAWLRCWARSRGRCPGHTARRSRRAAWTAWPRHGPASPGQAGSPPTRRTLALSSLDTGEIMSLKYTRLARPGTFILHITLYKVNVMWKWWGKHWAHEHTSELELEVRIMRNIWKCNVMIAEKSFTFLRRQGLGKDCLFTSVKPFLWWT